MMYRVLLAGAVLMMAPAAHAGEPSDLDCIATGYSTDQQAELDALLPEVDFVNGAEDDKAIEAFSMIVYASASSCAEKFAWSDAEIEPAMLHEFGRLIEVGFRRHGPFGAEQIDKIDSTLAKGDRTALWSALEDQFQIGMSGTENTVSDENALVMGAFILETGLGLDDETAEQVGVYLAAKIMQRSSTRSFAAQE